MVHTDGEGASSSRVGSMEPDDAESRTEHFQEAGILQQAQRRRRSLPHRPHRLGRPPRPRRRPVSSEKIVGRIEDWLLTTSTARATVNDMLMAKHGEIQPGSQADHGDCFCPSLATGAICWVCISSHTSCQDSRVSPIRNRPSDQGSSRQQGVVVPLTTDGVSGDSDWPGSWHPRYCHSSDSVQLRTVRSHHGNLRSAPTPQTRYIVRSA